MKTFNKVLLNALATLSMFAQSTNTEDYGIREFYGEILQSHSSFVHPDMNFFYAFATDNGVFYELDLETLKVSRTLYTDGTPLQGVFMCQGAECENLM